MVNPELKRLEAHVSLFLFQMDYHLKKESHLILHLTPEQSLKYFLLYRPNLFAMPQNLFFSKPFQDDFQWHSWQPLPHFY